MTDLLDNQLVLLYFQPNIKEMRANADLVMRGMQEPIKVGERMLQLSPDGLSWEETKAEGNWQVFHPTALRLPNKYQSSLVRVTCPDCKFTYEHQHVFAEGTK